MQRSLFLSSAAAVALLYGMAPYMAAAQQQEMEQQPQEQQQVEGQQAQEQQAQEQDATEQEGMAEQPDEDGRIAQECLEELRTSVQTLAQEGYWITGWGERWGWGVGQPGATQAPADVPPATGTVPQEDPAGTEAMAPQGPAAGQVGADPWGAGPMLGAASPRHQIRSLYQAANVLALQGDQEGCEYLLARMQNTADTHLSELREMGVQPDEVVDWRREAMAGAMPLEELAEAGMYTIDDLTGMDVRNLQDEHLGSVTDIILDTEDRSPQYVIVARGGFLGIGEDHVLVPWEELQAAPQLNVLILDVPEQAMEQAPAIDPDVAADGQWMQEYRQQTDEYWQQQRAG